MTKPSALPQRASRAGAPSRTALTSARKVGRRKLGRLGQMVGLPAGVSVTQPGPPAGVLERHLRQVGTQILGQDVLEMRHQHMSGWKSTGAYRVRLVGAEGRSIYVFCKVNDHRSEAITALHGFPARVGRPEAAVLRLSTRPDVGAFLPKLHRVIEREDAVQVLVMEDLGPRWHSCTAFGSDLRLVARTAARFQRGVAAVPDADLNSDLIAYNDDFSRDLNDYARASLERLASSSGEGLAATALAHWERLSALYLGTRQDRLDVVHGDLNTANAFVHVSRRRIKVIDWEWAGRGDGYRDLASLLKRSSPRVETAAVRAYHTIAPGQPDWRRYERCQLERGLLDASFLAAQLSQTEHTPRMDLRGYIRASLRRALRAGELLSL